MTEPKYRIEVSTKGAGLPVAGWLRYTKTEAEEDAASIRALGYAHHDGSELDVIVRELSADGVPTDDPSDPPDDPAVADAGKLSPMRWGCVCAPLDEGNPSEITAERESLRARIRGKDRVKLLELQAQVERLSENARKQSETAEELMCILRARHRGILAFGRDLDSEIACHAPENTR